MNQDFKQCIENKKIFPFERGKELVKKELSIGESDLSDAKAGFQEKRYKWSTIQSYYARLLSLLCETTNKAAHTHSGGSHTSGKVRGRSRLGLIPSGQ